MGNKPSGPTGQPKHAPVARTQSQDIIRTGRPENGDPRPKRPQSDPAGVDPDVNYNPNFSMSVRNANKIGGKHHVGEQKWYASNPVLETSHVPHTSAELDTYRQSLDQITATWTEYSPLRDLVARDMDPPVLSCLQQVFKRLVEQHAHIRELSGAQHGVRQELQEQHNLAENHREMLRRRELEIRGLREDIQLLRDGLKQQRHSGSDRPSSMIYDDIMVRDDPDNTPSRDYPEDDKPVMGDATKRRKQRERDGILKMTPFLQAVDGGRGVKRSASLRPAGQAASSSNQQQDESTDIMRSRLKHMENLLEQERRESQILRTSRIPSLEPKSSPLVSKKKPNLEALRSLFAETEALALGKLGKTLSHQLSHTPRRRQQQFMCAVVQMAFDQSLKTTKEFKDTIHSLLVNPAYPMSGGSAREAHEPGQLAGHIKHFEQFKPGQGMSNMSNMSNLAKRTKDAEEAPENLTQQIYNFLESTAEVTNISYLAENVVDALRSEFRDCTTPALLNQSDFSHFLYTCCRVCWQMCVPDTPLYVTSGGDRYWRFEENYHVTADGERGISNARVDFYVWPILFSRKNGEVLYKGRVTIKT